LQNLPHHYKATAQGLLEGSIEISGSQLESIKTAAPAEFGGPGDQWSPETLFVAAIADCFILTFRAISRASKLPWISLSCEVEGTLERVDHVTQFTDYVVRAALVIAPDADQSRAEQLLEKAEKGCLISNSLSGTTRLEASISVVGSE